ncbi:MAG TPA: carboxypeptidase-like regulatory domain-containing protein, partial [Puia sp.]|nr:carboxypeptidase-like regulatory domain-containing protein [Puia sp.]
MRNWKLFSLIIFAMLCMITNNLKAQGVPLKGTVLSDDGTPLSGVTVAVSGTKRAAVTNEKGEFTINAKEGSTLLFTYIGYTGK